MAVPLKKMVRGAPPQFELRDLPMRAWGALKGALKALVSVSMIAFVIVALALISVSYYYIDRPVAQVALGRARPRILFDGGVYGFTPFNFNYDWHSMPSGHSLAAAGFAAGLALVLPLPMFPVIAFFGAMIAFSRVTTTAHYFGDALAGGALAIICAMVLKGAFKGMGMRKIYPTWDPNKKLRLRSISRSMMRRDDG